jgi:hypothetical protein
LKGDTIVEEQEMLEGQKKNEHLQHLKQILPPFNSSSKSAKNIYKIENIISEAESIDCTNLQNAMTEFQESKGRHCS